MDDVYIGIDLGTSGCRLCAINPQQQILALYERPFPRPLNQNGRIEQDSHIWWQGVKQLLQQLVEEIPGRSIKAISINGTSGTLLACDNKGQPLAPALMYNDNSSTAEAGQLSHIAPADSPVQSPNSGLAKIMQLHRRFPDAAHFLHQADWIAAQLTGRFDITDENNALKSGYDAIHRCWPQWMDQLPVPAHALPRVIPAGQLMGKISPQAAKSFCLPDSINIIAGTTDSLAAFIATGASQPGDGVTSLGSTLVLKMISQRPIYNAGMGIYSHRLGEHWLAGGASNSGGAVLKKYFNDKQISLLSEQLDTEQLTGLAYYPLLRKGERFPENNPHKQPELTPRPEDDRLFFQGILEGISRIEKAGYEKLQQLGAPYPKKIITCGGGSQNTNWLKIRQTILGTEVVQAEHADACYGSALLALKGSF